MDVLQELVQTVRGTSAPAVKTAAVLQFNVRYTRAIGLTATVDPNEIWKDLSKEPTPVLVAKATEIGTKGLVYALCDVSIKTGSELEAIIRPVSAFERKPDGTYTNKVLPPDLETETVGSLVLPLTQRITASELKVVGMRDGNIEPLTASKLTSKKIQLDESSNLFGNYDVIIRTTSNRQKKFILPPPDELKAVFKVTDMQSNGTPDVVVSAVAMVSTSNELLAGGASSVPLSGQAQLLGYKVGSRLVPNLGYSGGVVLNNIQTIYLPWVVSVEQIQPNDPVLDGMQFDPEDGFYKIGNEYPADARANGTSPLTAFGSATASPLGGQSVPPPYFPTPSGSTGAGSNLPLFQDMSVPEQVGVFREMLDGIKRTDAFDEKISLDELVRRYKEFEVAKAAFIADPSGPRAGGFVVAAKTALDSFDVYGASSGYSGLIEAMPQSDSWMIKATMETAKISKPAWDALFGQFRAAFAKIDYAVRPEKGARKTLETEAGVDDGAFADLNFPLSVSAMACYLVVLDGIHQMDPIGVDSTWLSFYDLCVKLVLANGTAVSLVSGQHFIIDQGVVFNQLPGASVRFGGYCPRLSSHTTILKTLASLDSQKSKDVAADVSAIVSKLASILKTNPEDIPIFRTHSNWKQTLDRIDQSVSNALPAIKKLPVQPHPYLEYRFKVLNSRNINKTDAAALIELEKSDDVKMVRAVIPTQSFEDVWNIENASAASSSDTGSGASGLFGGFVSGAASLIMGKASTSAEGKKVSSPAAAAAAGPVVSTGAVVPIPFSSAEMLKRSAVAIPSAPRMLIVLLTIDGASYGPYVSTPVNPRVFMRVPTALFGGSFLALAIEPGRLSLVDRSAFLTRNTWGSSGNSYVQNSIEVFSIMTESTVSPPSEEDWNARFKKTWNGLKSSSKAVSRAVAFDTRTLDRTHAVAGPVSTFVLSNDGVHIIVQETSAGVALRGIYIQVE